MKEIDLNALFTALRPENIKPVLKEKGIANIKLSDYEKKNN